MPIWTIRDAQLDAMQEFKLREFETRALGFLAREFPESTGLDEDLRRRSVRTALEKGEQYGFDAAEDLYCWLELMYLLGLDFDVSPGAAWVQPLLQDEDLAIRTRLRLLVEDARVRMRRARKGDRS
jgi:hypothetical protein